jgi:hypothetical protein
MGEGKEKADDSKLGIEARRAVDIRAADAAGVV